MKQFLAQIYDSSFIKFSKYFSRKNLNTFLISSIKQHYKKNSIVLNVGAGGEIEKIILNSGVNSLKSVDIDSKRNPDYILSIEDLNLIESNSVDLIFCIEVLEHVKNPFKAVSEINRVLNKEGILIGSTPFLHPIHDEPYDFYRYTKYGLLNMFKKFNKLHLKERNSYIENVVVIILRLFNIGNKKQKLISILLFPINLLIILLLLIISPFISNYQATTGYTFIFQKK